MRDRKPEKAHDDGENQRSQSDNGYNPYEGPFAVSSRPLGQAKSSRSDALWSIVLLQLFLIFCMVLQSLSWLFGSSPATMPRSAFFLGLGILATGLVFVVVATGRLVLGKKLPLFFLVWLAGHIIYLGIVLMYVVPYLMS